jgi:hypothetical protein
MLALAIVFLLCVGTVWAQPQLEHLHFDRGSGPLGAAEYRIGMNAFTAAQLGYFLTSIERFLALADDLPDGDRVTLRQNGEAGYIALTAYETEAAPRYVLTLAAEEPTGITSRSGLKALWVLLAEQLEPVAAGGDMSFANP